MANYEQGIATKVHYLRLSIEDTERVRLESIRLGISQAELFRRMVDLYFEVRLAVPASKGPVLTPHQAESLLKGDVVGARVEDKRFDFTGEGEENE